MHRSGERNLLGREQEYVAALIQGRGFDDILSLYREEEYVAAVVGGEYTFYPVFGSTADVGLLAEWNYDERDRQALPRRQPLTLDNDFFVGARLAFNDVESTEIKAAFLTDASRATRTVGVEFDRRLSDRWSLHVESSTILSIDRADLQYVGWGDATASSSSTWSTISSRTSGDARVVGLRFANPTYPEPPPRPPDQVRGRLSPSGRGRTAPLPRPAVCRSSPRNKRFGFEPSTRAADQTRALEP